MSNLNGITAPMRGKRDMGGRMPEEAPLLGDKSPAISPKTGLFPVPCDGIDKYWPRIKSEVEKIIEGAPDVCDFIPEEIYVFLRRKAATLYVVKINGDFCGFGIVQVRRRTFSQEPYLLSWLGAGWHARALDIYFDELEKVAATLNIKTLHLESSRPGWTRRLTRRGWKLTGFSMEKQL